MAGPDRGGAGLTVCPQAFDVSAWEFFSSLCFGNTLHILSGERAFDARYLTRYLAEHRITTAYLPPTVLPEIADCLAAADAPLCLERLLVGVMPIRQEVLQRFRDQVPGIRIINGYGPTETTVCATFFPFRQADAPGQPTPIGKPVGNYRVYVLDGDCNLMPPGLPGEVCIGGAGVGRGYLDEPELTAQKFVRDPFSGDSSARMYRTGDLGRWLPDGNLEFIGRRDEQVKVRGYRIELGEIESVLQQSGLVQQGVVLAPQGPDGNRQLVGYLVPKGTFDPAPLTHWLQAQLPEHMVPTLWVPLPELPVTPNGKVDKAALLAIDVSERLGTPYLAPRTATEEAVTAIWGQLLRSDRIGTGDNFFAAGGNSLLAMQLVAHLNGQFGLSIPVKIIFEFPTLFRLAGYIDVLKANAPTEAGEVEYEVFEL